MFLSHDFSQLKNPDKTSLDFDLPTTFRKVGGNLLAASLGVGTARWYWEDGWKKSHSQPPGDVDKNPKKYWDTP